MPVLSIEPLRAAKKIGVHTHCHPFPEGVWAGPSSALFSFVACSCFLFFRKLFISHKVMISFSLPCSIHCSVPYSLWLSSFSFFNAYQDEIQVHKTKSPNTNNLKKKVGRGLFFPLIYIKKYKFGSEPAGAMWQLQQDTRHTGFFFLSAQSSGTSGFHPQSCLMVADGRGSSSHHGHILLGRKQEKGS